MTTAPHRFAALPEARRTWALAWPIMISQLAQVATGFVDAAMAGHASVTDLAAVSAGSSIWLALMVTIIGLLYGASPLISQAMGAARSQEVPELVRQSLWQGVFIAFIALGGVQLLLPVFQHLDLDAETALKARGFLQAIIWGLPGFAVLRVLTVYSNSVNRSKPPMVVSLASLALNILLNWLLIFGHAGFPALGAIGCGYATAVCMTLSALALGLWLRLDPYFRNTHPFAAWSWPARRLQQQLLALGGPIGMVFLVEVSAFSLVGLLIARLGTVALAAHQVALNFTALVFMAPSALGSALTVRIGEALGAGERAYARFIGRTGIHMALAYALVSGILIAALAPAIAALYTPDVAVRSVAATLLIFAGVFQFGDASQVTIGGILRGYKVTREPMLIYIAAFWLFGIPLGYVLAFGVGDFPGLGARGYWLALVLALFLAAGLLYRLFLRLSQEPSSPA